MEELQRTPYIITDPEILDFIIEADNNDFNPITFIKKAIRARNAPVIVPLEEIIPVTTSPTIPENCVLVTKAELKKLYTECIQLQNIRSQVIKSLQCKQKHLLNFCETHVDVVNKFFTCPQNCGYISATKIGLGLHLRKCVKNKTFLEEQSNETAINNSRTNNDVTEIDEEELDEFAEEAPTDGNEAEIAECDPIDGDEVEIVEEEPTDEQIDCDEAETVEETKHMIHIKTYKK